MSLVARCTERNLDVDHEASRDSTATAPPTNSKPRWHIVSRRASRRSRALSVTSSNCHAETRDKRAMCRLELPSIIIVNGSSSTLHVFVSKYTNSNGSDAWFTVDAGKRESWSRSGWELVAFKNADDTKRAGVYVPVNSTVTYRSLGDITWE
ncbi:hypothetical protein BV20DRAFT_743668 [Pilatotrama ljubarskyi]|nr:hypothetical protein BV20DRAFT_743668 [Pilatotrama ljubarskyi]